MKEGQGPHCVTGYVATTGKRVVVVHRCFPRRQRETPRREIETALKRAKEVK
jgi:phage-related protein